MIEREFTLTQKILLASKISGIGKKSLIKLIGDNLFWRLPPNEWSEYSSEFRLFKENSNNYNLALEKTLFEIDTAKRLNHKILSPLDKEYPRLLIGNPDQPPILFASGAIEKLNEKSLAVIGTREPSKHGVITCERITKHFTQAGWVIVSGLALGLDTVAHKACLASGGSTIAVLAHGLDKVSPKSNTVLAEQIVNNNGVLVTEYSYNTATFASNFVERDRIQAGLSKGVVMIQSDVVGGSLHASRAILSYDRLLIIPYPTSHDVSVKHPKIEGNLKIANGNTKELADFLKCPQENLRNVLVIRSKDDYEMLNDRLMQLSIT